MKSCLLGNDRKQHCIHYRPLCVWGSREQSGRSACNGISFVLSVSTKHQ